MLAIVLRPSATSSGVDDVLAELSSVHGLEKWTCRSSVGGGSSTESLPSVATTAFPPGPTLALQSLSGHGSLSTPRITSHPAEMAPAEKPCGEGAGSCVTLHVQACVVHWYW